MEGVHGLPNVGPMRQPSWANDNRSPSHGHFHGPPTPTSAGMLFQPTQATAALHARITHEFQGFNDLVQEVNKSAGEAEHYRKQCNTMVGQLNTAIDDIKSISEEGDRKLEAQKELTQNALNRSTGLTARVDQLTQDKVDLETGVGFLKAQLGALEGEKTSLQSDLDSKQTSWQTEREGLAADKAKAEEAFADQREKLVEMQKTMGNLEEDINTHKTKLDGMELESGAAAEKLQAAQGEVTDGQTKLSESARKTDRLNKKVTAIEDQCQTLEKANSGLGQAHLDDEVEIKALKAKTELQAAEVKKHDKDREDVKEEHKKALKGALDRNTKMRTEHDERTKLLNGLIEEANKGKNGMESKLSSAQIETVRIKNTLDKTRESLRSSEDECKKLESVNRKTAVERDAAEENRKELAGQVADFTAAEKKLRLRVEELERDLGEEKKIADEAREFTDRLILRKNTPKVGEESAKEPAGKSEDRKGKSTPVTPSKPPLHTSSPNAAAKSHPAAGHITPPPDDDGAVPRTNKQDQDSRVDPNRLSISVKASAANTADSSSTQSGKRISFTLPGQTSPKASPPKRTSPLTNSGSGSARSESRSGGVLVPTGPKQSNDKDNDRKRRRDEEPDPDPRLPKRPSGMPRKDSYTDDRYRGSERPSRPPPHRRDYRASGR